MLRPRELVRLSQLFEKDANQGQLISAVRVENLQPGTKKKKTRIIYVDTKAAAEAWLVETADDRLKYAGTPPPTAQLTGFA